jgi:uncharacterized protein
MAGSLSDRLRSIVRPSAVPVVSPDSTTQKERAGGGKATSLTSGHVASAAAILGGSLAGSAIVVDRLYEADARHGRTRVGDIVDTIAESLTSGGGRPLGLADGLSRLMFLDLETTGLAGGAGTQAFLIGCASFEGRAIRIRQFVLPGFEYERDVLKEFADFSSRHGTLVTFNGRTFDSPLIETRFLFHRLPFPLEGVPHLDMLHSSRRLWRTRPTTAGQDPEQVSCSLSILEKDIAGLHRIGDVPGFEIPSRYFQFIRDGDARPLEAVMEHNRLDLISTAAVMARVLTLIERGPSATSNAPECLGLARLYERGGSTANAEVALLYAIDLARLVGTEPEAHGEALRRLAWLRRRARRPHEAAQAWSALAALPGCRSSWRREAREALAIFHEHRSHDLGQARSLVLDVLNDDVEGRRRADAVYRLQRIERKLSVREQGGLLAALDATLSSGD